MQAAKYFSKFINKEGNEMTRESKIVCRNQFKNTDTETSKAEFNRKMELLISFPDRQVQKNGEKIMPVERQGNIS
jgi:nitrogen regulatory protein PII